ncbi:MAG: leucyl aminopeptidase family protein [Rhodospirillales bacterium]|nr:leucyl aminopeptidase family protein [Rhodospirillales bacterium]
MPVAGLVDTADATVPLVALTADGYAAWLEQQPSRVATWLRHHDFAAKAGSWLSIPEVDGDIAAIVAGLGNMPDVWSAGALPMALPEDLVVTLDAASDITGDLFARSWAAGCYRFTRYRKADRQPTSLLWPEGVDEDVVGAMAEALALGRDLVNTPAQDMGPAELEDAAEALAEQHGGALSSIHGERLLSENLPAVHAVGRASSRAPRLIDLTWGSEDAPRVTLVGKGVCFDTGGHNLKSASGMERMKKDMGGAACVLAVAHQVMATDLPVRLRVIIPAVDNALDGNAIKPADILPTRKGIWIEIGDTDAEGRVILADGLALACEEKPGLLIDFATLTGAARVALGNDLPACFSNSDDLMASVLEAGDAVTDPLWPMPLLRSYMPRMAGELADVNTIGDWSFADHIQAALFLEKFVADETPWLHIDTVCWNDAPRPGRPKGGEIQSARAVFEMLRRRYRP